MTWPSPAVAALLSNTATLTVGVNAKCTVAIQCICGLSLGNFFVFKGPVQLKDRYNGIKVALGANREIFTPVRVGVQMRYTPLSIGDYGRLLTAADQKYRERLTPGVRVNAWLTNQTMFPIWRWSFSSHGLCATILCGSLALLLIPALTFARWWLTGASWMPELVYGALFILVSAYDAILLGMRREVCYIRVNENGEGGVTAKMGGLWYRLYNRALADPPASAYQAVEDVATGRVRKLEKQLLIPVMAVKPFIEFDAAAACLSLTHFRAPVLAVSYYFTIGVDHKWVVAFGIAAFVQACLQHAFTNAFLSVASPYEVFWFRRLPVQVYTEEFVPYRTTLG
jgi:hypothetical protein